VKVAIASNGFAEGPAQALRDYLVAHGADVTTIFHPLTREQGTQHLIARYADGGVTERRVHLPVHAPLSYLADPFVPLTAPKVDVWFGFNPLACLRGIVSRAPFVVLWSVDFVPDRFGKGTPATWVYDHVDRFCCVRANARVELTEAARAGRAERHELPADAARAFVVPMGAWLDRLPTTPSDGYTHRRVVFLGHLVERQGVDTLLRAAEQLGDVTVDVIGTGPLEEPLRRAAGDRVRFHGFVADHRRVEQLLAESSVAVAPYARTDDTFTRYADPGKLKAYLAAGLPIVLTDVPPNARDLAESAGAEIVADGADALATGIGRALADGEAWRARREAALAYAKRFDWNILLGDFLSRVGLSPEDRARSPRGTQPD
jgi:glycosyltransferase involved in cell wall biosynthesis